MASLNPAALGGTSPTAAAPPGPPVANGGAFERELQRASQAQPQHPDQETARSDARRETTRRGDREVQAEARGAGGARQHENEGPASRTDETESEAGDGGADAVVDEASGAAAALAAQDPADGSDLSAFVATLGALAGLPVQGLPAERTAPGGVVEDESSGADPAGAVPDAKGLAGGRERRQSGAPAARAQGALPPAQAANDAAVETQRAPTSDFQAVLRAATPAPLETKAGERAAPAAAGTAPAALALVTGGAPTAAVHGAAATAQATLGAGVGSREFAQALGAQLTTFARDGVEHARLNVHPAELGPITLKLALEGTHVRVDFAAEAPATRQALEQSLPALAGALREGGFTLSGGGVFQQARDGGAFAQDGSPQAQTTATVDGAAAGSDGVAPLVTRSVRLDGLIDLYA